MAAADVKKPHVAPPGPPSLNAKPQTPRQIQLAGHVGFDSLPDQLVRKTQEHGFVFNLMCVGETGIGKSTLIESLFNMSFEFQPCSHELRSVELRTKTLGKIG